MKNSNIIAAGRMMSIALILFGVIICAATFTTFRESLAMFSVDTVYSALYSSLISGLALIFCGVLLMIMFKKTSRHPVMAGPALGLSIFALLNGVAAVVFMPLNPFAWVMVLVCVPIFITAVCLKVNIDRGITE